MFQRIGHFQYWLISLAAILLISVFGRSMQLYVIKKIDPFLIAAAVFLLLFIILILLWSKRATFLLPRWVILFAFFILVLACIAVYMKILMPVEAVHFLVFSWFGWISSTVFGPIYGAVAVLSISVGDEVFQHYLPNRIGDIHDVIVNLVSGYTGLILRNKWY